jgi:uncharacterized protein YyaL (SSP411 family)
LNVFFFMARNRLAQEKSPYLLQHAENPVDWFAWGEEAFAKARAENKPIFLSIGYSTCHWCHVMAHESFEDEETAALMNREFVNVKVDREERPDVDRVYMTFVQAMTGHGGWPMSVWLTPNLQPFVGGTYFPPQDRQGHPGFRKVIAGIATAWKQNREKIIEQGERIIEVLRESQSASEDSRKIDIDVLDKAFEQFSRTFDAHEGGFGNAPKFPRPVSLNFLTRYFFRHRGDANGKRALDMDLFTLRKMAAGGMRDHLGGGFHRYSVDRYWHVPHFEKMLYDQAQLAVAYLEAFQITQDRQFESVTRDILDYVLRDMTSPEGGFFSAEDADSLLEHGQPEHAEGAFYAWTEKEIDDALGEDAEIFKSHHGVQPNGNAPEGSDPQNEFVGKNILIERGVAKDRPASSEATAGRQSLARSRERLLSIRNKRPRPHLDDKIIAAWNGLMISAFARAGAALNEPRYIDAAKRAAEFVRRNLWTDGVLFRSYREGRSNIEGFADDYAFVIQAIVDLYEATFEIEWLEFAVELQNAMDGLFWDDANGGYFSTSGKDASVVLRMKDDNDSAEPAASSVAALNLLRLAQIFNRGDWRARAEKTINAFAPTLNAFPSAMPQMLVALDYSLATPKQIVIAGKIDNEDTRTLAREVHSRFLPNKVLMHAGEYLGKNNEAIRAMSEINGKTAAYVCEDFTCQAPVTDPEALRQLLSI